MPADASDAATNACGNDMAPLPIPGPQLVVTAIRELSENLPSGNAGEISLHILSAKSILGKSSKEQLA
jgi:hypothetical protein